ncbi:hypothetical protein LIER_36312 [Lithospermum erythrorhizon]|uniref:Uncharacterized protein n=1 Tax=Lithospermum erythrorhizon TaxID=34254 RepID=A0AAV3P860_LITER
MELRKEVGNSFGALAGVEPQEEAMLVVEDFQTVMVNDSVLSHLSSLVGAELPVEHSLQGCFSPDQKAMLGERGLLSASGSPPQCQRRVVRVEPPVKEAMPGVMTDAAVKKVPEYSSCFFIRPLSP